MATKKPAGPERVHSKSFNGAARGTVLQRFDSPTNDSYFGSSFALVEFDHHPQPVWSTTKFLKKPTKDDLYESWRAKPELAYEAARSMTAHDFARACAAIACGRNIHHDGAARWVGLARAHGLEEGTRLLVTLLERLSEDPAVSAIDEPAAALPGDYNKSDFKYGPGVNASDMATRLHVGVERFWSTLHGGAGTPVSAALTAATVEKARGVLERRYRGGAAALDRPLNALAFSAVFGGTSREYNARCGLSTEHPMVNGTGY